MRVMQLTAFLRIDKFPTSTDNRRRPDVHRMSIAAVQPGSCRWWCEGQRRRQPEALIQTNLQRTGPGHPRIPRACLLLPHAEAAYRAFIRMILHSR
jgi:hypothetical protein